MPESALHESRVRPMVAEDLPRVLAWRNDERVRRFMFTQHTITAEESAQWFARESADPRVHLLIFEQSGVPSGYVRLHVQAHGQTADWGFYAAPDTERGTGRLLGRYALDHAFGALALHKVCGQALGYNEASIRFHARMGFTNEGVLREQFFDGSAYHDVHCFGLLASEWRERKESQHG